MFPTFEILGKTIGTYAVCSLIGFALCAFVATRMGKRSGLKFEDVILLLVYVGIGLLIGGHIMYGITNAGKIIELFKNISQYDFKQFMATLFGQYFGGMVFYGGLIGGFAAICIYSKFSKSVRGSEIFDIFAVSIPLFHTFGRIGCFFGGCCYGVESSWGFIVHDNHLSPEINGVIRIPIQLIEAGCNLIIFFVVLLLFYKNKMRGKLLCVYGILYPIVRFITEFFRGDEIRGFIFGMSTSQFISILIFIAACSYLFINKLRGKDIQEGSIDG